MATVTSSTLTNAQILPPPQTAFVNPQTGVLSGDGYKYFTALLNQIASAVPTVTVGTRLAAAGTTQATALLLTAGWNEIDTASAAKNGVILSPLQQGQAQSVINLSGMTIDVYPPPGVQIDALGINNPYALANGTRITFDFFTAAQVRS